MLLSEMTVRPWRSIGAVEYIALRRGPVIPEHGHAPLAERYVAGLLALCFSGRDCQIPEFRALRGFQFHLCPFEAQRFPEPQSGFTCRRHDKISEAAPFDFGSTLQQGVNVVGQARFKSGGGLYFLCHDIIYYTAKRRTS